MNRLYPSPLMVMCRALAKLDAEVSKLNMRLEEVYCARELLMKSLNEAVEAGKTAAEVRLDIIIRIALGDEFYAQGDT